jgi:hypothetical protein
MLGWEVEVGQQDLTVLEQFVSRLWIFGGVGFLEAVQGQVSRFLVLGVHDGMERRFHFRSQARRDRIQHVGDLVNVMPTSA